MLKISKLIKNQNVKHGIMFYKNVNMGICSPIWNSFDPFYNDYSDSTIMKKYGLVPEAETLELVKTIANKKQVVGESFDVYLNPYDKKYYNKMFHVILIYEMMLMFNIENLLGRSS